MKAKEIRIKEKVHDVGYRLLLLSEAERLLIGKFDARNVLVDSEQHLIVLVEGSEERIKRFVEFAESNCPQGASVGAVAVKDYEEEIRSIDSFRQSFMVFQLTKIAQLGVGMLGKQDAMLGKQDAMLEKQDKTIEILGSVKGDTSKMLEKQDETIKVIKEESEKTREVLKDKIQEDVEWIKEEIIEIKATLGKVTEKVGVV